MKQTNAVLTKALQGDINAFQELFAEFQEALKSYLYRLTANRNDAEDLTHDTFIRSFDKLHLYKGASSLKTWIFQIATNLAYNQLKKQKRWTTDVLAQAKDLVTSDQTLAANLMKVNQISAYGRYEIKEHIDTCFTCMGKTLLIEHQIALILKDIYDFSVKEMMQILDKSEGTVKYLLQEARKKMTTIFDNRCALINQQGICHQCSELNGWLNPKQNQQEALAKVALVKQSKKYDRNVLFELRTQLIKNIDPLRCEGNEMQEMLMQCNRMAMEDTI
ncbi:MAG TPA: RNA polymerase subunit sigma-24 [Microscillaceae bacterium]|nr:RNA polymerase subunit sigma-24 [Microscillaceae bacterium]